MFKDIDLWLKHYSCTNTYIILSKCIYFYRKIEGTYPGILTLFQNQKHNQQHCIQWFEFQHWFPCLNIIQSLNTLFVDRVGHFWKTRYVSIRLQNLFHFHAPFFTNQAYFTPYDRPPLFDRPSSWVAFREGCHCITTDHAFWCGTPPSHLNTCAAHYKSDYTKW